MTVVLIKNKKDEAIRRCTYLDAGKVVRWMERINKDAGLADLYVTMQWGCDDMQE